MLNALFPHLECFIGILIIWDNSSNEQVPRIPNQVFYNNKISVIHTDAPLKEFYQFQAYLDGDWRNYVFTFC
jgi:hypothetical protein